MNEYDIALKSVIRRLSGRVLEVLTGFAIGRWHNVERPEVRALRADMIGETADGRIVHVELQSTNDSNMALRMAEYALAVYRHFRQLPEQIVLYVGQQPMRMAGSLTGRRVSFTCSMVDIRDLDGEPLLASANLEDNVIALLMRLGNERNAVRRILRNIAASETAERAIAVRELAILAGLRSLGDIIRQETKKMPILTDFMDHDWFGPVIRKSRLEGEQTIMTRQIEKRFGPMPAWARQRLNEMSVSELEEAALRLLDTPTSLADLLGK